MRIGIIGAMREEILPILNHYEKYEEIIFGNQTYYKIQYDELELYIVQSKIGKVAAAMTATILISKFNCDKILFSGVAGGLSQELEIGDLVIANDLCHHDVDITAFGHPKGHIPEVGIFLETSKELRDLAQNVAKNLNLKIHYGTIATGDQFVSSDLIKNEIIKNFDAIALEMEGVAVAQVCRELKVDCLILRSISDKANGDAPENFDEFVKVAAKKSSDYLIKIIESI